MNERDVPIQLWDQIDESLSRSEVMQAFLLYRKATGCSVETGKVIVGQRFRERFPELWAAYRNLGSDD